MSKNDDPQQPENDQEIQSVSMHPSSIDTQDIQEPASLYNNTNSDDNNDNNNNTYTKTSIDEALHRTDNVEEHTEKEDDYQDLTDLETRHVLNIALVSTSVAGTEATALAFSTQIEFGLIIGCIVPLFLLVGNIEFLIILIFRHINRDWLCSVFVVQIVYTLVLCVIIYIERHPWVRLSVITLMLLSLVLIGESVVTSQRRPCEPFSTRRRHTRHVDMDNDEQTIELDTFV